jgi:dihydropteroate synthase type 2
MKEENKEKQSRSRADPALAQGEGLTPHGPALIGIVNLSPDSFSDGGLYGSAEHAVERALELRAAGAAWIELGPAASNPDAAPVPAEEEQRRLLPVLDALDRQCVPVGIDSFATGTQRFALRRGVRWINDIQGFPEPELYAELAASAALLVVMHSIQGRGVATRERVDPDSLLERIDAFFTTRIAALEAAGVRRRQLILDPGMGLFLGTAREASLRVLRALPQLRARFGLPILVSVSRKSFLAASREQPPIERGPATLAAELFAADQGADYVRTHDVGALRDALRIHRALRRPETSG